MNPPGLSGRFRAAAAALALLPLPAACGSGGAAAGAQPAGPTGDPVVAVRKVDSIASLLPVDVRASGTPRIGGAVGYPPSAYYPGGSDAQPVGLDVDIVNAVARVLGIRVERQVASFETMLPALGSGKSDVGTGNFGVTTERLKSIDFVTHIDDGQGFAVRTGNTFLGKVTTLTQLCGLTIGTGAGTTFQATLSAHQGVCAAAGREPYQVKVFSESGALVTALQQGRVDVEMSTINGLRYQASQAAARTTFLGEFHRLDVGFAFKKGSFRTRAFQAAVNRLIGGGTYARILRQWGTTASAIPTSLIDPPEHT